MSPNPFSNRRASLRGVKFFLAALGASLGFAAVAGTKSAGTSTNYSYYLTGSSKNVTVAAPPTQTAVLMGGGTDVKEAFSWMIKKAGGGDFVVLRTSGSDGYNSYLYKMGGLDSVETLVIHNKLGADDPFVEQRLLQADAVFIAGGDQSEYIKRWKGTKLARALDTIMKERKVPVGGTSAGLAVIAQFDYTGENGSISSPEALANPYDSRVTIDSGFLTVPFLEGVVTDSHLVSRDRMGRMLTFLARVIKDGRVTSPNARAIGVDSETALLMEDGTYTRVGRGSAYFLRPTTDPATCEIGKPLTFRNVQVARMSGSGSFQPSSATWTSTAGAFVYELSAESGTLTSTGNLGSIY